MSFHYGDISFNWYQFVLKIDSDTRCTFDALELMLDNSTHYFIVQLVSQPKMERRRSLKHRNLDPKRDKAHHNLTDSPNRVPVFGMHSYIHANVFIEREYFVFSQHFDVRSPCRIFLGTLYLAEIVAALIVAVQIKYYKVSLQQIIWIQRQYIISCYLPKLFDLGFLVFKDSFYFPL